MERRKEPRFESDRPVEATVLQEPAWCVKGRIVNHSARGLQLLLEHPVPLDAAVRIDIDDALILGEVAYCRQERSGYRTGLRLEHAIYDLPEVHRLMRAILNSEDTSFREGPRSEPETARQAVSSAQAPH